ncbi:MAG TPA: hypothetical protein VHK01_16380, partial [Lacipirellulaceae bacterium]|nr:hypothetical protein [Lacipirellulaceae bacterium]
SAALPVVNSTGHHADRFSANSIPGAPVGDKVQIAAVLNSTDPVGSPTISVTASQGDTTITLDYIGAQHTIFNGQHVYYKFIDYDPALTGFWQIIPTDSTGTGPSTFTNPIPDPEFLPLVEDITLQGMPHGGGVSWTLPNFDGFDPDALLVRVMDATSGGFVFESQVFPVQTTSYEPPAGVLQVGIEYAYAILLGDVEGSYLENTSWAFSEPFRFTLAGDYNTDGSVDTADYVVWRKGLGTTYNEDDYGVWREHFGASHGPGSGSALPSAESLSAAVPEPCAIGLVALGATAYIWLGRRRASAGGE